MFFDSRGLPKDNGATDYQDSSRLAGIMAIVGHEKSPDCARYIVNGEYRRHPLEYEYDFSRDQTICLIAGLWAQGHYQMVDRKMVTGKDIFTPAHMGHFRRCANKKSNIIQDAWLWLDVLWSCFIKPMAEPNQLLCMLFVAESKYLKFWTKYNKQWEKSISTYWNGWRNESEISGLIIKKVKSII
jgi:hypothetical protein